MDIALMIFVIGMIYAAFYIILEWYIESPLVYEWDMIVLLYVLLFLVALTSIGLLVSQKHGLF